jgi:hypothetical protein
MATEPFEPFSKSLKYCHPSTGFPTFYPAGHPTGEELAASKAADLNAAIAEGRLVEFQSSGLAPMRRVTSVEAEGRFLRFNFQDGESELRRQMEWDNWSLMISTPRKV